MPDGKPAGVPCIHLTPERSCALFGLPERPEVCINFMPSEELCGCTDEEAYSRLERLEKATRPGCSS